MKNGVGIVNAAREVSDEGGPLLMPWKAGRLPLPDWMV